MGPFVGFIDFENLHWSGNFLPVASSSTHSYWKCLGLKGPKQRTEWTIMCIYWGFSHYASCLVVLMILCARLEQLAPLTIVSKEICDVCCLPKNPRLFKWGSRLQNMYPSSTCIKFHVEDRREVRYVTVGSMVAVFWIALACFQIPFGHQSWVTFLNYFFWGSCPRPLS